MSTTPSLLSAASSLVLLQALTRILTFVLNQCLVRLASPEVFGTATIQFELLLSTILFLSREGIRNALLRTDEAHGGDNKDKNQLVTNISVLPITIGIPVTCFATLFYLVTTNDLTKSQPHFHLALTLYCLSAGIELLSEPLYIRAINQLRLGVRVRAEGAAVVAKSVGTVGLMIYLGSKWSLVAFSGGQLMYAITVLGVYLREYWSVGVVVMPRKVHGK
jgi:oligosaccharide translocation protein RFT1